MTVGQANTYNPIASGKAFIKVRYTGEEKVNYVGLISGKSYGIVAPKTTFYILFEDTEHEDFDLVII